MEKNIDEKWKESANKEKEKDAQARQKEAFPLKAAFNTIISGMAMEAMIFLGEIPNPMTKKKEVNLEQARYIIDTINVLKEKTKGNLTAQEANTVDSVLYELHTKYLEKNG